MLIDSTLLECYFITFCFFISFILEISLTIQLVNTTQSLRVRELIDTRKRFLLVFKTNTTPRRLKWFHEDFPHFKKKLCLFAQKYYVLEKTIYED